MGEIENTQHPLSQAALLADILGGADSSQSIYAQEARGQRMLVNSTLLPADTGRRADADFEALGFVFGEGVPGDGLFREATLPEGWSKQATNHSMWSDIVDEHGRVRVEVFYKAAFYDRRAFMSLTSVSSYVGRCVNGDDAPILDENWATRESVVMELAELERTERQYAENQGDWLTELARTASLKRAERAKLLRETLK